MLQDITDLDFPPVELLDAQRNGELLLFCGAGVSMSSGLPSYKGLVADIAKQAIGIDLWDATNSDETNGKEYSDKFFSTRKNEEQSLKYLCALFKQDKLDAAVSFLETYAPSQNNRHSIRRGEITEYIRKRFYEEVTAPKLDRHKQLLRLATHNNLLRLVTTNFDNFFERSFEELKQEFPLDNKNVDCHCYHAPLLPPVQPTRWSGVIKLHGTLYPRPEQNLRDELILGSGDFGRAYLTERWASRFVTDLFRHFHVLFVGYSINDPVMRYIVDAYSLDAYHDTRLKSAYLLTSDADSEDTKTRFAGSNVKILTYGKVDEAHSGLDKRLQNWLTDYPTSSVALKQRVSELAKQSPTDPDTIRQLIKALTYSTEAVKYFCDASTNANISWLQHLEDAGLLVAYKGPPPARIVSSSEYEKYDFIVPLVGSRFQTSRTRISESAEHFCQWLSRNLDKREFIDWLLNKGGLMHPALRSQVVWQLWSGGKEYNNKGQPTPYNRILNVLTNQDIISYDRDDVDFYYVQRSLAQMKELDENASVPLEIRQKLFWLFNTNLSTVGKSLTEVADIHKTYLELNKDELVDEETLVRKCFGSLFELDTIKDYNQKQILTWFSQYPKCFADMADDFYILLKRAFNLLRIIKENSYTYIQRPYIKEHSDNRGYANWDTLVDLVRDSLDIQWRFNAKKASILVELMLEEGAGRSGHIILTRLALHALTSEVCPLSATKRLEIAFPYHKDWLYSWDSQPEAGGFLRKIWNDVDSEWQKRVAKVILVGNAKYKGKRSKDERESHKRIILRRLRWVKDVAKDPLPRCAEKIYYKLNSAYPETDPFSDTPSVFTMRAGSVYVEEINYETFITFTPVQHLAFIDKNYGDRELTKNLWHDEYNNALVLWQEWTQRAPEDALAMLRNIAALERYPHIAWSAVLRKYSEYYPQDMQEQKDLIKRNALERTPLLEALRLVPDALLSDDYKAKEGGFIREACESLQGVGRAKDAINFDKDLFIEIWRKLMPKALGLSYNMGEKSDIYTDAINHPAGTLTEGLFHFMWQKSEGKYGEVSSSFQPYFEELFANETESIALVCASLAAHLYPLYIFLPDWTERNILPLLDWDTDESLTAAYWGAYMYNPRLSEKLAQKIKPYIIKSFTPERLNQFDKHQVRENLVGLATNIMLEGSFDDAEIRGFLSVLQPSDQASIARLFLNWLGVAPENEKIKKWQEMKAWLLKIQQITRFGSKASDELSELFLSLNLDVLAIDWEEIKGILQPLEDNDLWMFYYHIAPEDRSEGNAKYISVWNRPELAIEMVSILTADNIGKHPASHLDKVLNKAREVLPNADNNIHFRRLLEIQTRCS